MNEIFKKLIEYEKQRLEFALCVVVNTKGSTPRKMGAKMIVLPDGKVVGTIGGGEFEKTVIKNAIQVIKNKKPQHFRHDLLHQHNMCCGGTMEIYIEPMLKKNRLYIFGAGHVGQALANQALNFDFEVILVDDRKEYLEIVNNDLIHKLNFPYHVILPSLPFDNRSYVCVMTYDHQLDRDILSYCVNCELAYIGMIGSKRKVEVTKKMFFDSKVCSEQQLLKIDMPMGIDINAEGPEEIALSIMSKLIQVKNQNDEK